MIFYGYFGPHNYEKAARMLHCSKNLRGALLRLYISAGALLRLQNSAGQKLAAILRSFWAFEVCPRNYKAFEVRPAEFWSNAMCVTLYHGDIVTGAKIPKKSSKTWVCLTFKVFFVNHGYFRDIYKRYDFFFIFHDMLPLSQLIDLNYSETKCIFF